MSLASCLRWVRRFASACGLAVASLDAAASDDVYEEVIRTPRGVYVMRGHARADQADDVASASVTATTPDGTRLFHRMTDLRPGCDGFSARLVDARVSGQLTRLVLLCGSSGGPHQTLFAFIDGTGTVADLDGDRSNPEPYLGDERELYAHSSHSGPIAGIDGLFEFPGQHRLQAEGRQLSFVQIRGRLFSPWAREMMDRHARAAAASPEELPRFFVAAHALLGDEACAHIRHEQPHFAALIGDSALQALNRWVSSEMSVKECK